MKVTMTLERIEEMVLCIVHNNLNEVEACDYAKAMALECLSEDAEVINSSDHLAIESVL
jgi:hypothetical protein